MASASGGSAIGEKERCLRTLRAGSMGESDSTAGTTIDRNFSKRSSAFILPFVLRNSDGVGCGV